MIRSFCLSLVVLFSSTAFANEMQGAASEPARLKFPSECILGIVAKKMTVVLKPEITVPLIRYESQVTLEEFQDAVEPWWKFRPGGITNVFIPPSHQIFLIDDASYYEKHKRAIDDSLAHEFTHFIQAKYQNADLSTGDDWLEFQAIEVQTWFRETYIYQAQDPEQVCGGFQVIAK